MSTAAQQRANQENAQHSTGPRTAEGKQRSSQNALKHGLCALDPLIPGEDPDAFQQHFCEIELDLQPATAIESNLVEQIVGISWRLKRLSRIEAAVITAFYDATAEQPLNQGNDTDQLLGRALAHHGRLDALNRLSRYEAQLAPLPPRPQGIPRPPQRAHPKPQFQRRLRPLGRQATATTTGEHPQQIQKHRTNPIHHNPIRINRSNELSGKRHRPKHPRHHQLSSNPPKTSRPHRQPGGRKVTPTSSPNHEPPHPQLPDTQPAPKWFPRLAARARRLTPAPLLLACAADKHRCPDHQVLQSFQSATKMLNS